MTSTLNPQWIVGFVDGEGCFTVSILNNRTMKLKVQVIYEFVVVQHVRDKQILKKFQTFFKCGSVAVNHGDRYHFRVRALSDLNEIIVPFFYKHPLQTQKASNFEKFKKILAIVTAGQHLNEKGLENIRDIMNTMNNRAKRQSKILEVETTESVTDVVTTPISGESVAEEG